MRDIYESKCKNKQWTFAARAYLLHLVGCTIFANKSSTLINVVFLDVFRDLNQCGGFSWGAAALVHMYENLNYASMYKGKHLAGYITLLQSWIYEYFPTVGSMIANEEYHESNPRACRWRCGKALPLTSYRKRLDRLATNRVAWRPYAEHRAFRQFEAISLFSGHIRWGPYIVRHMPERVLRQFGHIQTIPPPPTSASLTTEQIDEKWLKFSEHVVQLGQPVTYPGQCAPGYIDWFYVISHPFMTPTQEGDPPRDPPIVPDPAPVMPQPPPIPIDIDMPRHAVVACEKIGKRLQHMLDRRMITAGSEAYTITEECVRIARSVTEHRNVYVRSRRGGGRG